MDNPTPYPEINHLLRVLLRLAQEILGNRFIGMYLEGSLANGDFDQDSDIDFMVVTTQDVSGDLFTALQAMHDRIATLDSWWAVQLEGSYISQQGIRRFDPEHALHPNIERDKGQRLKMLYHDLTWATHRYILRERGITLAGPPPQTLIDPVSPEELRQAVLSLFHGWMSQVLEHPQQIHSRGYQSYTVLTLPRMLYTLQFGEVVSKSVAARWAHENWDARWSSLIERAWVGRHHPQEEASAEDVRQTLEMIRYSLAHSRSFETPARNEND